VSRLAQLEGGAFDVRKPIREAVAAHRPVVALESTIITHGMPFPANLETALEVERIVRGEGAVPATIAVLRGRLTIGLFEAEIERLAGADDVAKASRRDLAALAARRADAGTTVAATMIGAACAGIPIFATGGIGGVHRGAAESFDISADLLELARTPVAVVCSGCKSILDIGKTLEVLETHGVPVLGYGTDEFPAFFARSSGHRLDHRFDDVDELGAAVAWQQHLRLGGGLLIANPVPDAAALPGEWIEAQIAAACREAAAGGIGGKALTPFLLARINALTGGASLRANVALIKNNARLAARLAVAIADRYGATMRAHGIDEN